MDLTQRVVQINWDQKRECCQASTCVGCSIDPKRHSIYIRGTAYQYIPLVYTRPSEATWYNDSQGIEDHFRGIVRDIHPSPWVWVFDADGLTIKHVLNPYPGIRLARLFSNSYQESLSAIYIMNSNLWVSCLLNIVWPFLNNTIRQKIVWI